MTGPAAAPGSGGSRRVGRVAMALVAGLIVGILVARAGNPALSRAVAWLEPVGAMWVNAIRMTVVPLVVALLLGAVGRGSETHVGRLGGLSFGTFVALHAVVAAIALALVPGLMALLPINPGSAAQLQADATAASAATSEQVRALPGFGAWIASLAPANVVRAAADGAMLPLIVFTLLFALALRRIPPERRDNVMRVFDGVGAAMLEIVRWLIALAPIGIFTLVAPTAARLGLSLAGSLGFYALAYVVMMLAVTLAMCVVGPVWARVSLPKFVRAALPAQAVAFSSSSSLASLPALIDSAERLDVPRTVAGFVLPLAVASFKVGMAASWLTGTVFLAHLYGVPLGLVDHLTIVASAIALSFATPGVPNGAFLLLVPVLASYNIPAAGVALLIAVDAIPDLFATTANVTGDFTAVAIVKKLAASRGENTSERTSNLA
ncbi:MAG TPA: cation:dicarboxylase symporter family transporter [Gemmatimonadaceae bacterium]|nr:cation:dicarboxylase symporter family transporter [Gemmatimonadaceae bacterium]